MISTETLLKGPDWQLTLFSNQFLMSRHNSNLTKAFQYVCGSTLICDSLDIAKQICYEMNQKVKGICLVELQLLRLMEQLFTRMDF